MSAASDSFEVEGMVRELERAPSKFSEYCPESFGRILSGSTVALCGASGGAEGVASERSASRWTRVVPDAEQRSVGVYSAKSLQMKSCSKLAAGMNWPQEL